MAGHRVRVLGTLVALLFVGCGSHPEEGTLVEPAPGVAGIPGGREGVLASRAVPISGGTLLVARDGVTAVAADPDRDRVFLVNLADASVRTIVLEPGDEPGRAVEDGAGRVHVALRRGGALVAIEPATGSIVSRRQVCAAPRGVAYDSTRDVLHIACQSGELVSLNATTGETMRVLRPEGDLRDVIVSGDHLLVSRFRSAELLNIGPDGQIWYRAKSTFRTSFGFGSNFAPSVAWRTVAWPDGGAVMMHQRTDVSPLPPATARYYGSGPCNGGILQGAVGVIEPAMGDFQAQPALVLPFIAGPTDVAVSADGQKLAIVATGNSWDQTGLPRVIELDRSQLASTGICDMPQDPGVSGEPVAVAFDGGGRVVIQSREPAQLQVLGGSTIRLSQDSRADSGVALFHMNSGGGVACASCHPEGTDDSRTWVFNEVGPRRTQFIAGHVLDRAPYHWGADLQDFRALVDEVFVQRMGASRPNQLQAGVFGRWLDTIEPPPSVSSRPDLVELGRQLFHSAAVGCADCHSGSLFTDSHTYDVGTGGVFKVPSLLGVGAHAPYLHTGCAATLHDRFGSCGGGDLHGTTSQLSGSEIDALVAFLETL